MRERLVKTKPNSALDCVRNAVGATGMVLQPESRQLTLYEKLCPPVNEESAHVSQDDRPFACQHHLENATTDWRVAAVPRGTLWRPERSLG